MTKKKEDKSKWQFLMGIVDGLKQEPAYLLIFAISALLFLFGLVSGIDAAVERSPERMYFSVGSFVAALIAAVAVIFRVQRASDSVPTPVPEGTPAVALLPSTGNHSFDDVLTAVHRGIKEALGFDNAIFREAVLEECGSFRAQVADWSNGQLQAHGRYNQLLLRFYEHAQKSVFSTSIPDYLSTWMGPFGEQLMEAHRRSHAATTRVFVFNNRKEVTPDGLQVMATQVKAGINVRLYFNEENRAFSFPPDVSRDFTVIDEGEAIGITLSFGGENLAAMWYIQDGDRKQRILKICDSLLQGSLPFSAFQNWFESSLVKGA